MDGWIKLHRKIRNNEIFNNHQLLRLWLICLTEATHKERDQIIGKQTVHLMPGQFITGRFDVTDLYNKGLKPSDRVKGDKTVFRWLENLGEWGFLTLEKTNKFTVVTIDKWEFYQSSDNKNDHQIDQEMTNKRPSNDQQMTTNKNVKNDKNDKNEQEEKNKKTTSRKNAERVYSEDDRVYKLAKRFHELAFENAVELGTSHLIKEPNFQKWADTFRLILDRDKIPESELGEVIKYGLNENFYRTIIFSPTNLREHYAQILTKMRAQQKPIKSSFSPSGKPKIEITKNEAGSERDLQEYEKGMQRAREMKEAREKAQKEGTYR